MAELQQYQLNGSRPWFRFWFTLVIMAVYSAVVILLLVHPVEIDAEVNGLVFTLASGLNTVLVLAAKWWFDNMNADESQSGHTTAAPPAPAQPAAPEPEQPPAKKALPDDY